MVKAAILGFGTVGSGVAEVMKLNEDKITRTTGGLGLKYIVDIRSFPGSEYEDIIVKDFALVENDPEVKIVVETIGGSGIAYEFTKRCLKKGKTVVTSNKELVATHGVELMSIASEHGASYFIEACVGGGIPIIRPISQCLAANTITEIYGILNGTTNYILTQMQNHGSAFDTALKQAQEMGYAEADPSADINGPDVCRKISILADMCSHRYVDPNKVPTEGIADVTDTDIELAARYGCRIKLLGRAMDIDGKTYVYVAPHLIPESNLLSSVDDVMNAIVVKGNAIGTAMFYGPGAGKLPTASAVVADMMDAVKHLDYPKQPAWEDGGVDFVANADELEYKWYVRTGKDAGIGKPIDELGGDYAWVTEPMTKAQAQDAYKAYEIKALFRILQ